MAQSNGPHDITPTQSVAGTTQDEEVVPNLRVNGQPVKRGQLGLFVYPFFLVHMGMFGLSGFIMAYFAKLDLSFLFMHGGFAILVYLVFYHAIFGKDEVKWMFINAGLGIVGVYTQVSWLLARFGKDISEYPLIFHVIPFLYFILYTFLIRQMFIDIIGARKHPERLAVANTVYVAVFLLLSAGAQLAKTLS